MHLYFLPGCGSRITSRLRLQVSGMTGSELIPETEIYVIPEGA